MAPAAVGILGPLVVAVRGVDAPVTAGKQRAFLASLALQPGDPVPAGQLTETIWGERAPRSADHALAVYASELRRLLGPGAIVRDANGYRLAIPRTAVDLFRFETGARIGRLALEAEDNERAAAVLEEALALFRGDPLGDVPGEALEPERERIRAMRLAALEDRIEAELRLGRHLAVACELEALVTAEPLRERAVCLLLLALYRSGRQAEALARYRAAQRYYRDELGLEPGPELLALERRILRQDPTLNVGSSSEVHVPRLLSRFVGRAAEVAELRELIGRQHVRLVTVTGAGGIGKTRMAMEAAHAAAGAFEETRFVELAPLGEPRLLETTVARAFSAESLAEVIRDRRVLLVLDNLEHLLAGVREVAGFLRSCPNLTVLATSRERLRLTGEHVFELDPLEPADAVALFDDRARAITRRYEPSPAVDALCERLDNMPLAIELAAARLDEVGVDELLAAWSERLDLELEGARDVHDRHRTLDAAISWSHDLLDPDVRAAFLRASAFRGGFTREAARVVADADERALDALVRKSLVLESEGRYRLLEPVRQFAAERLDAAGDTEATLRAHADHYAGVCSEHGPNVTYDRSEATASLQLLDGEYDNIRAVLRWARRNDRPLHARVVETLMVYWFESGRVSEGRREIQFALDGAEALAAPERAGAYLAAALVDSNVGEAEGAREHGQRALALYRQIGDDVHIAHALGALAITYFAVDPAESLRLCDETVEAARRAGNVDIERFTLINAAYTAVIAGEYGAADRYLAAAAETGEPGPLMASNIPSIRALVDIAQERWESAGAHLDSTYELLRRHPWTPGVVFYVLQEGVVACATGDAETAALLLGTSITALEESGLGVDSDPVVRQMVGRLATDAPARLGHDAYERAYAEGAAVRLDDAMELARRRRLERTRSRGLTAA